MSIVGNKYLERGEPVEVLAQWRTGQPAVLVGYAYTEGLMANIHLYRPDLAKRLPGAGPRNVLIRRADGDLIVRPFRGLRKVNQ